MIFFTRFQLWDHKYLWNGTLTPNYMHVCEWTKPCTMVLGGRWPQESPGRRARHISILKQYSTIFFASSWFDIVVQTLTFFRKHLKRRVKLCASCLPFWFAENVYVFDTNVIFCKEYMHFLTRTTYVYRYHRKMVLAFIKNRAVLYSGGRETYDNTSLAYP